MYRRKAPKRFSFDYHFETGVPQTGQVAAPSGIGAPQGQFFIVFIYLDFNKSTPI